MQIESLHIISFGGLRNFSIDLSSGLTVIEGANESGKSTIAAFIKFMLYGFTDKAERTLHTSWEGDTAEGSMIVNCGGNRYKIGRRCRDGRDECQIIECASSVQHFKGRQPGEVFLGVDAEVFSHTAYVSQIGGGRINGEVVTDAIGNILFSADETLNVQRAQKRLEEERVRLWHKNKRGGRIYELECEREELLERQKAASADYAAIISKEGQLSDLKAKIKENAAKLEKLSKILGAYDAKRRMAQRGALEDLYKRIDLLNAQREQIEARYRSDRGFLPDERYIAELNSVKQALENIEIRISELDRQTALVASDGDEMPDAVQLLRQYGGPDEVMRRLEEPRTRKRTLIAFAVVFGLLFIPATVIAVSLMVINFTYGAIAVLGALALLFGLVMCFISSSKYARAVNELLDDFGAENANDLKRIVNEAAAYAEQPRGSKAVKFLESELEKLYAQREAKVSELARLLARWGRRNLDDATADLAEYMAAISSIEEERKKTEAELAGAMAQIGVDLDGEGEDPALLELAQHLPDDFNIANVKREHEFLTKANASMAARTHELELELAALNAKADSPAMIADRITAIDYELARLRKQYKAVELAAATLQSAAESMRENIAPKISDYAGRMMEAFSGGRYRSIAVAADLSMSYDAGSGALTRHGVEFMSAGTQDIAYLSLRLALINLMFRKGTPPLIFDESFTRLDDGRLRNVLRLLEKAAETGTQIIIFTAQPREYTALTSRASRVSI